MHENAEEPEIQVKTFTLKVETPDGTLPPVRVQVPDVAMGLADVVPPVYQMCSGMTELAIRRSDAEGKKVSCNAGCGVCCRQLVPLSIPEAIFLAEYIYQQPADRSQLIRSLFADAVSRINQAGLLDRIRTIDQREDGTEIALEYFRLSIACPFLINESCGIYQFRPCACREFNVTSSPHHCDDPQGRQVDRIRIHRKMTSALAQLTARLTGTTATLIPFPLILEWYENNQDIATLRWKGIGLFELMITIALGQPTANSE